MSSPHPAPAIPPRHTGRPASREIIRTRTDMPPLNSGADYQEYGYLNEMVAWLMSLF